MCIYSGDIFEIGELIHPVNITLMILSYIRNGDQGSWSWQDEIDQNVSTHSIIIRWAIDDDAMRRMIDDGAVHQNVLVNNLVLLKSRWPSFSVQMHTEYLKLSMSALPMHISPKPGYGQVTLHLLKGMYFSSSVLHGRSLNSRGESGNKRDTAMFFWPNDDTWW